MALPDTNKLEEALGSSFVITELMRMNPETKIQETVLRVTTPFYDTKNDAIYVTIRESINARGEKLLYISDEKYASNFLWSVFTFRPKAKQADKMIRKIIRFNNTDFNNGYLFIRLLPDEGRDAHLVSEQIKNLTRIVLIVTSLPLTMK